MLLLVCRNPTSFPLKRTLYFDASHDNQIVSILTAIGLKNTSTLPANGPPAKQDWVTSQIVPFSGRLVTERLDCDCGQFIRFFLVCRREATMFRLVLLSSYPI